MEAVGARLGRSSSRYGPAVVFSGRVRKWKKRWVHVSASRPDPPTKHTNGGTNHSQLRNLNGTAANGGNGGSRLLLYKWTPLSQSNNGNGSGNSDPVSNGEDNSDTAAVEEPPRRRFKFVPIAVLEEQKNEEDTENDDNGEEDGAKASDAEEPSMDDLNAEADNDNGNNEKPDINDVPMEENQEQGQSIRQDLNEALDLSLG